MVTFKFLQTCSNVECMYAILNIVSLEFKDPLHLIFSRLLVLSIIFILCCLVLVIDTGSPLVIDLVLNLIIGDKFKARRPT